jgi:RimJ/RimL family protein N-acetyltransferase
LTYIGSVIFPDDVTLRGDGLILREWTAADVPAMVELFDEESIDVWTPLASPFDGDVAQRYVDRAHGGRAAGICLQLAITTDGRAPLGEILLFEGEDEETAELAYAVGIAHRGQHLTARAMRLTMEFARQSCGIKRFMVKVSPANPASESVARAAGLELTNAPLEIRERKGRRVELAVWRTADSN